LNLSGAYDTIKIFNKLTKKWHAIPADFQDNRNEKYFGSLLPVIARP